MSEAAALSFELLNEFILNALKEDIGEGDHTSSACINETISGHAHLLAKETGIIAGVSLAKQIFNLVDRNLEMEIYFTDGSVIKPGDIVFDVQGNARSILTSERLVLNCMQRMSGIATYTQSIVSKLKDYKTKIVDTRKTTPGIRMLEKWAVRIGGGENHRMGLYDMIMIKDNHIDFAGGIKQAISSAKDYLKKINKNLTIEIEARSIEEIKEIIETGGVDRIMLDNFNTKYIKKALKLIGNKFETEASGGITINNVIEFAKCGVNYISIGALTHSVKSLDLSLKVSK